MEQIVTDIENDSKAKDLILVYLGGRNPSTVENSILYETVLNALELDVVDADSLHPYQAKVLQMGLDEAKNVIYAGLDHLKSVLTEYFDAISADVDYTAYASLEDFIKATLKTG